MTRRHLVVLAADKDMEHALRGLLSRHKSLPIRQIAFDIFVHPQHDAACATRGVPFLPRSLSDTNTHCRSWTTKEVGARPCHQTTCRRR